MLKQTIEYEDFDGNKSVETLHFNISKSEISDNLTLHDEIQTMQRKLGGEKRDLSTAELQELITFLKKFIKLSYGVRSADGKRFVKNEQVWEEFTQTAAYDAFVFSLFENPEKFNAFLEGIMPQDVIDEARKAVASGQTGTPVLQASEPVLETRKDEISDEDLLKMRPQDMTPEQMQRAYLLKTSQQS